MRRMIAAAGLAAALMSAPASHARETLEVVVDRAAVIRAPAGTATLVVGNPLIADTSIQPGGVIVVTGKSYGITNFVALDATGALVMDMTVNVRAPDERVVTVHRGVRRESYSCTPVCERTLRIGDDEAFFNQVGGQFGTRNTLSQGQSGTR